MDCNNNYNCHCCDCYNECDNDHKCVEVEAMTKEDVLTFWNIIKSKFARISHKHSAGDIDSGVLSVDRGGTGADDAAGARENLEVAAAEHTHDFDDINFVAGDVLDIAHGGTGKSDKTYIRTNLSSTAEDETLKEHSAPGVTGILDIDHGGTGADDASEARANLGASADDHTHDFDDIVFGNDDILDIAHGGTGAASAADARVNLEIPDFPNGVLPIAHGGTGGDDDVSARANLNAAHVNHTHYTVATAKQHHETNPGTNNQSLEGDGYINFNEFLAASDDCDLAKDPVASTFTGIKVPTTGKYLVSAQLNYAVASTRNVTISVRYIRNGEGTDVARAMTYCSANENTALCIPMQFVELNAGDIVRLYVSQAGAVKTQTGAALTVMFFESGMY